MSDLSFLLGIYCVISVIGGYQVGRQWWKLFIKRPEKDNIFWFIPAFLLSIIVGLCWPALAVGLVLTGSPWKEIAEGH